jgi:HD superfamily phosphohydrolase YqeK
LLLSEEFVRQKAEVEKIANSIREKMKTFIAEECTNSQRLVEQRQTRLTENVKQMKNSLTKADTQ